MVHYGSVVDNEDNAKKLNQGASKDLLKDICSNVLLNPENFSKIEGD